MATTTTHDKERTLTRDITRKVEGALPGTEVLAVELSGPDRFTVFVDHAQGVDHGFCARVSAVLRDYAADYSIEVSSPGIERPLRTPQHFRNAVGHRVTLRTPTKKRLRGEVVEAGDRAVTIHTDNENIEVPYEDIVRGNLVYEGK
jgi:ribosome maturation factor RimP